MTSYRLFTTIAVLCTGFFVWGVPFLASAQSGSFTVRPAKVELVGNPGETVETYITVENHLGSSATFSVSFEDIAGSENPDDAVTLLGTKRGPYPLRDLLRGPKSVSIPVGGEKRIPISVNIPSDASPGGLYGSVIFTPVRQKTDGNVLPDSRLGVLLFLRVAGTLEESGGVKDFSFEGGRFVFGKPEPRASATLLFENSGTVHLNPYGEIRIKPLWREERNIPIDPWYVLPKSTRSRNLEVGEFLSYGYQAITLTLHAGYDEHTDTRVLHVFIFPSLRTIGLLLAMFCVLLYALIRRGKTIHV
jgi:hypothetical protein